MCHMCSLCCLILIVNHFTSSIQNGVRSSKSNKYNHTLVVPYNNDTNDIVYTKKQHLNTDDHVVNTPQTSQWSKWSRWSSCSVTCGVNGRASRKRLCLFRDKKICKKNLFRDSKVCQADVKCLDQPRMHNPSGRRSTVGVILFPLGFGMFVLSLIICIFCLTRKYGQNRTMLEEPRNGGIRSMDTHQTALAVHSLLETHTITVVYLDEDDLFQCGKCSKQFTSLSEFVSHKQTRCASGQAHSILFDQEQHAAQKSERDATSTLQVPTSVGEGLPSIDSIVTSSNPDLSMDSQNAPTGQSSDKGGSYVSHKDQELHAAQRSSRDTTSTLQGPTSVGEGLLSIDAMVNSSNPDLPMDGQNAPTAKHMKKSNLLHPAIKTMSDHALATTSDHQFSLINEDSDTQSFFEGSLENAISQEIKKYGQKSYIDAENETNNMERKFTSHKDLSSSKTDDFENCPVVSLTHPESVNILNTGKETENGHIKKVLKIPPPPPSRSEINKIPCQVSTEPGGSDSSSDDLKLC